jgi:hypothetical protein
VSKSADIICHCYALRGQPHFHPGSSAFQERIARERTSAIGEHMDRPAPAIPPVWRQLPPTRKQAARLRRWGLGVPATRGEASDLIGTHPVNRPESIGAQTTTPQTSPPTLSGRRNGKGHGMAATAKGAGATRSVSLSRPAESSRKRSVLGLYAVATALTLGMLVVVIRPNVDRAGIAPNAPAATAVRPATSALEISTPANPAAPESVPHEAAASSAAGAAVPTPAPQTPATQTTVWVANTDGEGVYLRQTPVLSDKLGAYADGTEFQVTGASVQGDGTSWYPVRASDSTEGYIPTAYVASERPAGAVVNPVAPATATVTQGTAVPSTASVTQPTASPSANLVVGCNPPGLGCGQISTTTGLPRTEYVSGYTRRDGTHVQSYYRSHR